MHNSKSPYKIIASAVLVGLLLSGLIWLLALHSVSKNVRSSHDSTTQHIQFGPLNLGSVAKTVTDNSSVITITGSAGVPWLTAGSVAVCIAIGFLVPRKQSTLSQADN